MCELLGMSVNVPTDVSFSFTGLSQRGGATGPHGDGWGKVFYESKGCRNFRDPKLSATSEFTQNAPVVRWSRPVSCNWAQIGAA
jgi:glutamine amidotransferase